MAEYDIVTVGGGLGASALAKAMAENGRRVLVVERETQFKDRVRGEWMAPWGVNEAKDLGIYETLIAAGGHHPAYFDVQVVPAPVMRQSLAETAGFGVDAMTMYHPQMQERLIAAAETTGAEVRRGWRVRAVQPGPEPVVQMEGPDGEQTVTARLVVAADGRSSMARKWGGFAEENDPPNLMLAGVLLDDCPVPETASLGVFNPMMQQIALLFPQGGGRTRAYLGARTDAGLRPQGDGAFRLFVEESIRAGAPAEAYEGARQAGPLASFDGADSWIEHPYQNGIALVGDAAATSDQTWGQGLSLTLRDVRGLRDELLANDDWDAAGHAYAAAHDRYFRDLRTVEGWMASFLMGRGPEADALRGRVFGHLMSGKGELPETFQRGPERAPASAEAHYKLFGEAPTAT